MSRNKTGLIILTILAGVLFLFIAFIFNSSTKMQAVIERKADLDEKFDEIAEKDITIYWIGEPYKELEHLMPVISVVTPGSASANNLPVKGPSFHTTEYNTEGMLIEENIPIDYPEYMVIVITGSPVLTENGKEALLDAVAKNGVPVLAVGDDASEFIADLLSYRRLHKGEGSSFYYCLGSGCSENPIPEDTVKAGGIELSEAMPGLITLAMSNYIPQN